MIFYINVDGILAISPYAATNRKNFTLLHFHPEAPALLNENPWLSLISANPLNPVKKYIPELE